MPGLVESRRLSPQYTDSSGCLGLQGGEHRSWTTSRCGDRSFVPRWCPPLQNSAIARAMELLAVVNLGCDKHPIFHGGGLLPGVPDRGIRVLTPCVYAPQGKSAVRPISYLEALVCKDVPETLAKVLVQLPVASDAIHWGFTNPREVFGGRLSSPVRGGTNLGECEAGQGSGIVRAPGSRNRVRKAPC
jgi:hypothetical protein